MIGCATSTALLPAGALAPPHSGYHMRGRRRGFEGWYHRLSLPNSADFAFIYSIFDPADAASERHGVGVQILGPDDTRVERTSPADGFWADEHALALGHTTRGIPLRRPSSPAAFARFVEEGFQFTSTRHQGVYADASWSYEVTPLLGWGGDGDRQYSTAGWLAAVPVFDPHYQVLMAHGRASGHVCWRGERYDFDDAIVYSEKNWGDKFPSRWFWMECNTGWSDPGVITLTVAGGRRAVPVVGEEDVAMIALHTEADLGAETGKFLPFPNVEWQMGPWGQWRASGEFDGLKCLVEATADDAGVSGRVPTAAGMVEGSRESFAGALRVRVWRDGEQDAPLIDAASTRAALELGGAPWDAPWVGSCEVRGAARAVLSADVPLDAVREWIPGL